METLGTTLVESRSLIFEIGRFQELDIPDVNGYVASLRGSICPNYKTMDVVSMGVGTFVQHAVEAMKNLNPQHKLLYRELAVYVGGSLVSHTEDLKNDDLQKQIRKSIRSSQGFKSLGR